jgi:hypothetical protein
MNISNHPIPNTRSNPGTLKLLLTQFSSKNKKQARKEFLSIFSIRNIKRAFKNYKDNKVPTKTSIKVRSSNDIETRYWNQIVLVCVEHHELFEKILEPRRFQSDQHNQGESQMSYNFTFCNQFFSRTEVKDLHLAIVDLLFSNPNPSILIKKFKLFCCFEEEHSIECCSKWKSMEEYLKGECLSQYVQNNNNSG